LFELTDQRYTWQSFLEALSSHGVRMSELGYGRLRAVTHYAISDEAIDQTLAAVQRILG
jgi:threonine aldolase